MRANYHMMEIKSVGFEEGVLNKVGLPTSACWSVGFAAGRRFTVSVRLGLQFAFPPKTETLVARPRNPYFRGKYS